MTQLEQMPIRIEAIRSVIELARHAPSIHNAQPWLLRVEPGAIQVHADPTRLSPTPGADDRQLLLSCGVLLHHLRVAARAAGMTDQVHRLPDPDQPRHIATIVLHEGPVPVAGARLARAITSRRSDRREFATLPLSSETVAAFAEHARAEGAVLRPTVSLDRRRKLVGACQAATRELLRGDAHRDLTAEDARLWAEELRQPDQTALGGNAELLAVLATVEDTALARLRAGEALSAVLLAATHTGLASCVLSRPFDVDAVRTLIRDTVLDGDSYAQALVRVGWRPVGNRPLPATPRRSVEQLVVTADATASPGS